MSRLPLRVGLVGAGRILQESHLPAYELCRGVLAVTAVADVLRSRAESAARRLGLPVGAVFTDAADLFRRDDIDLVVIATPPATHLDLVLGAAARGMPVVCEKPLVLSEDDAAKVRSAAGQPCFVAVLHNYLYQPGWQHLRRLVRSGAIGRPLILRFEELSANHWDGLDDDRVPWRQEAEHGNGPLHDNLYHAVYLAEEIAGSFVGSAVTLHGSLSHQYAGGDTGMLMARHLNGTLTQALASWCHAGWPRATAEVVGERGTLRYRYWAEPGQFTLERDGSAAVIVVPPSPAGYQSGYTAAFSDIARRLVAGEPPPWGLDAAVRVVRTLNAASA